MPAGSALESVVPLAALIPLTVVLASADLPTRVAVGRGLKRLEQAATSYVTHQKCFSCHHQALPIMALARANAAGFTPDATVLAAQTAFTLDSLRPRLKEIAAGRGVANGNTQTVYALRALESLGHPADEVTDALVAYLLIRQKDDGSWAPLMRRPPGEGSAFTGTALALRALARYGAGKSLDNARAERVQKAVERGRAWIEGNVPADTEDRVWQLQGLIEVGAAPAKVVQARDALLGQQLPNGSWAQLPDRPGDAYATGTTLVALARAGVPAHGTAYKKGTRYLLTTQQPGGGWVVETRSRPVRTFFDNGDPGGKSQFISTSAAAWAVLALLETLGPRER